VPLRVWLADPRELSDADEVRLGTLLDDEERARAARFRFARHRREFVAAHALARLALEREGGRPAASWRFVTGSHGRPALVDPPAGLTFNISHTSGLVACAVGRGAEIGVDVEHTDRGGRLLDVAERYFSADEAAELRGHPPDRQARRFLEYWTLKEAYIKARGLGLALPLGQFTFGIAEEGISIRFDPELGDDPGRWRFTLHPHGRRHLVATAVSDPTGAYLPVERHDGLPLLR
jgi:4'-phosphopantetheinyl transferase